MSIADKLTLLNNTKASLRTALNLSEEVPFSEYVDYIPTIVTLWTPDELFKEGQKGFWYEPNDITTVFKDVNGISPVIANNDPIGLMKDKSPNTVNAVQPVSSRRPSYRQSPPRFYLDRVDDELVVTIPTGGWVGDITIATDLGTATYGVSLPVGNYLIGTSYFPSNNVIGILFRQGSLSLADKQLIEQYFVGRGAVASYLNATSLTSIWREFSSLKTFPLINTSSALDLSNAWHNCQNMDTFPLIRTENATTLSFSWYNCFRLENFPLINTISVNNLIYAWFGCSSLTSFPALNTSSVINFNYAWYRCSSLTSFPLLNTSSATNFSYAWYNCLSLTTFPENFFDNIKGGNLSSAFYLTNLNQTSIDCILKSLVVSGISTGTRVFGQSGGSAPSSAGRAAIDTLRARGWTVTVTGGY